MLIIPFVIIAVYWFDFPSQIPIHWSFSGEIDSYTNKEIGLFLIPGLNIIFYLMFLLLPRIDPRKENYQLFSTSYQVLRLSIIGFFLFLFLIIVLASLGYEMNVGLVVIYLTIIMFLVFGNYMGKLKSNYFVGIKTAWTLESPDIWNKTHRFAGKLWVSLSFVMIAIGLFIPMNILTIIYFVYIGIIALVPIVYSYVLHVRKRNIP